MSHVLESGVYAYVKICRRISYGSVAHGGMSPSLGMTACGGTRCLTEECLFRRRFAKSVWLRFGGDLLGLLDMLDFDRVFGTDLLGLVRFAFGSGSGRNIGSCDDTDLDSCALRLDVLVRFAGRPSSEDDIANSSSVSGST